MSSLFWHWIPRILSAEVDPYSPEALLADIKRLRDAWRIYRRSNRRDAVYHFLTYVFDLAMWWQAENRTKDSFNRLQIWHDFQFDSNADPFVKIIRIAAGQSTLDRKLLSKWILALHFARQFKRHDEQLRVFIKANGGINKCAHAVRCRTKR